MLLSRPSRIGLLTLALVLPACSTAVRGGASTHASSSASTTATSGSTSASRTTGISGSASGAGTTGATGATGTTGSSGSGSVGTSGGTGSADAVWSPATVIAVVDPMNFGAAGDGQTDDLGALQAAVNALPASGGIVYFPAGKTFKKTNLWTITKSHVKVWAPNRQATLYGAIAGQARHQATICQNTDGCGFFGVKFTSDASARFDALEDNQIAMDGATNVEVIGNEIHGSAATGVFLFGSQRHFITGNYVHHTWADHIHHTKGARTSWVWDNFIFNEAPSNGDDGVACVTYGPSSPTCGDMEWWNNTILHTGWGRGYSVIGGDHIEIHHNWAIQVGGAGVIVASEPSFNSASSDSVTIHDNWVDGCGWAIGHPGILISGLNTAAPPLSNITLTNNVSAETANGEPYRAEGAFTNVSNVGLSSNVADLPQPKPTAASVVIKDTSVLMTRDPSFVPPADQLGLYRLHVRPDASGTTFQQRFEYVVKGSPTEVQSFIAARTAAGDYLSEQRTVNGTAYALVLTAQPVAVPSTLAGVSFEELRAGEKDGSLSWLWAHVDQGRF